MADNVPITPGTGEVISTEEVSTLNGSSVAAQQVQRVIPALRTGDGAAVDLPGDQANGIDVDITRVQGTVTVDGSGSTQPVSVASLPLPAGAATSALQQTDALTNTQLRQSAIDVNTDLVQPTTPTDTQPVSALALPLPSGASTAARQDTGNTSVASIDTKTPALGQALAATSVPVVLPAAQITTLTPPAAITGFAKESGGNLDTLVAKDFATQTTLAALNAKVTAVNTGAVVVSSSALPSGASTADNQTNGTQLTKITDGTNVANVLAGDTGFNGMTTSSGVKSFQFTTSGTGAQDLGPYDCRGYSWLVIHPTTNSASGMVLNGQFSQTSGGTYSSVNNFISSATGVQPGAIGTNTANYYSIPILDNFFKINITALVSGTFSGTITLSNRAGAYNGGSVSQVGTWTVGSNSATGSAVPANAFYVGGTDGTNLIGLRLGSPGDSASTTGMVNALGVNFNGSSWDRQRSVTNTTNSTGIGITAVGVVAQFDDTSPTAITENQFGNIRMSANRNLYGTIRDAAGNERGLNVDANGEVGIGAIRTSVTPGTAAANLGKAEDAVHTTGDVGVMDLGVRNDTLADQTNTNADYGSKSVDIKGRVMVAGAPRALKGNTQTQLSNTTTETTIIAATASTFHDVYGLILANTGASTTKVSIRDATTGTVRAIIEVPTLETRGFMLPVDSAMSQTAVNNNWTAQCGTATTALEVTALYVSMV